MCDLVHACNNHTKFDGIRTLQENASSGQSFRHQAVRLSGRNWHESVRLNGGYHQTQSSIPCLHSLREKANVIKVLATVDGMNTHHYIHPHAPFFLFPWVKRSETEYRYQKKIHTKFTTVKIIATHVYDI